MIADLSRGTAQVYNYKKIIASYKYWFEFNIKCGREFVSAISEIGKLFQARITDGKKLNLYESEFDDGMT